MLRRSSLVISRCLHRETQRGVCGRWWPDGEESKKRLYRLTSRHMSGNASKYNGSDDDVRKATIQLAETKHSSNAPKSALAFATCDPERLHFPASKPMLAVADVKQHEIMAYVDGLKACPKYGLHNPLHNVERYLLYGQLCAKVASVMSQPEVLHFFARLIQRVSPKSYKQAFGEVMVTRNFLQNFSGDQVRFLASTFGSPGDHKGQSTAGYRWPYGPVAVITPFNFPLEIPALQVLGALFMGNKPLLKVDQKVSVVMEQFLRLLIQCGMPATDVDFINCSGPVMHSLLLQAHPRNTVFTGSSRVGDILAKDLLGRIKLEGAGFDWKVLGPLHNRHDPDAFGRTMEHIAYVCDQDAHACSGQKCSAQSMLVVHESWQPHFSAKLKELAARRTLEDLTVGPLLSVTTKQFLGHVESLLTLPGAKVLWGGKELNNGQHSIPECYGAVEPTAVYVPIESILASEENFKLATTEVFGPMQVVTGFRDDQTKHVYELLERMEEHLTAAIVSNDPVFQQELLSRTVNGTTYVGIRARTTGAPQNHWFGPAGDPRAAGIGTAEAIRGNWSCHREIISDIWPVPAGWSLPPPS